MHFIEESTKSGYLYNVSYISAPITSAIKSIFHNEVHKFGLIYTSSTSCFKLSTPTYSNELHLPQTKSIELDARAEKVNT